MKVELSSALREGDPRAVARRHLSLGRQLEREGQLLAAIRAYGASLAAAPDGEAAWRRIGAMARLDLFSLCELEMRVEEPAAKDSESHFIAANVCCHLREHRRAIAHYDAVLAREPDEAQALARRESLQSLRRRAEEELAKLAESGVAEDAELVRRAVAFTALEEWASARTDYRRLLAKDADNAEYHREHALVSHRLDDHEGALASFAALAGLGLRAEAIVGRACTFSRDGRLQEALDELAQLGGADETQAVRDFRACLRILLETREPEQAVRVAREPPRSLPRTRE